MVASSGCSSGDVTHQDGDLVRDGSTEVGGDPPRPEDAGAAFDTQAPDGASDAAPDGGGGIAARHPGDVGIENDPDVIFADGFETYTQAPDLAQKWDNFFQASQIRIVTDPANVRAGTATKKWYDNVAAARSYIGPMTEPAP
jgi:hypothetical protein